MRLVLAVAVVILSIGPLHAQKMGERIYPGQTIDPAAVFLDMQRHVSELDARDNLRAVVSHNLRIRYYAMLETIATAYRGDDARSASGLANLALFYLRMHDTVRQDLYLDDDVLASLPSPAGKWDILEQMFDAWALQYPGSTTPEIGRLIGRYERAKALGSHGWHNANPGMTDRSAPELLRDLREALDLQKSWLSPDPHWYWLRIQTGILLDEDPATLLAVITDALQTHPNYYQNAFIAFEYLVPAHDTGFRHVEAWAAQAVDLTGGIEGDALYARIYWYALQSTGDFEVFTDSGIDWTRFKHGMKQVLDRYPDNWNINNFAFFACLRGDQDETRRLMERMNGLPIRRAWRMQENFHMCREFAHLDPGGEVR